jgi:hypothetical protein
VHIAFHRRSFPDRALGAAAAVALLVSFALPLAVHPAGAMGRNWLEAARGLCAGLSIGMNLLVVRRGWCARPAMR